MNRRDSSVQGWALPKPRLSDRGHDEKCWWQDVIDGEDGSWKRKWEEEEVEEEGEEIEELVSGCIEKSVVTTCRTCGKVERSEDDFLTCSKCLKQGVKPENHKLYCSPGCCKKDWDLRHKVEHTSMP